MVHFNTGNQLDSRVKKTMGIWSKNYFLSKVMCFFVIPHDDTIYAIIHSTHINNHENNSILFERWQLETLLSIKRNGQQSIFSDFHIVDVNTFGDPILAVEDYMLTERLY